jgi:cardiolipin synthase
MKKNWLREYFSIPNLMGYFRILMLPVFLTLYVRADSRETYIIAFVILAVSFLTDFLDGKIARRFNMITDFGKALDPTADKLTQGTLILAVAFHYPLMWFLVAVFLLKEGYMAFMGLYLKKKKQVWNGAQWYGKVCTMILDVGLFVLLLFIHLPMWAADVIILVMALFMLFSLIKYILFHIGIMRGTNKK